MTVQLGTPWQDITKRRDGDTSLARQDQPGSRKFRAADLSMILAANPVATLQKFVKFY